MADEQTQQPPTETANPYDTNDPAVRDAVAALVKKDFDQWSKGREGFTTPAYRNLHYARGRQWIRFDRTAATGWRPVRLAPGTPTPVTNVFARIMGSFISMLARFEPSLTFAPGSHDAEDRAAADVASRAIEVIKDETNLTTHRQQLARWVGYTGGAWRETGYDPDPIHGMVDVPMETCPMCGWTGLPASQDYKCGDAQCDGGSTMPAIGQNGEQLSQPMPRGALYVDVCSLFEMFFDPSVTDWAKQTAYLRQKSIDVEKAKARWPEIADSIRADSMSGASQFMETLATLGPQMDDWPRGALGGRQQNTKVTENYYYRMPDARYPEGLLVVMLGKTPTQLASVSPLYTFYENADGSKTYFLPHVFFPQEEVPGSAWPKTVADDLAPKQAARNRWEAMIEMCGKRMANPVWLLPQGSNVRNLTGEPGQQIEYNPLTGHKPERIPGQPITSSFIENIARIDAEMNQIGLISEVMSGVRPEGISAGIALQILKERGESQFGPMFIKWNHAEAQWAKQALAIARQFWTEERLRKIKGRDGAWEVQKFLGADLSSTVDVVAEAGVTMPRSTMTERAEMEELAMHGVLNPAGNQADRRAFLKAFGKLHLLEGLEKETRNAIIENEAFEAIAQALANEPPTTTASLRAFTQELQAQGAPPTVILGQVEQRLTQAGLPMPRLRPMIDDNAVHGDEHRNFAREQTFREMPEIVQLLVELHTAAHDFLTGQAMQAAADARGGAQHGGGFLSRPGPNPGSAPSTPASRGGSSPQRMEGDAQEMEQAGGRRMA